MHLSRFLDPKNDVAFKKIFGSEKNKDIPITPD
ncbi:putative transposase [Orientia tsutsugamushi str. Karp]|nr:putative transposase [Orientia tsutsugamushi str. Karp]